MRYGARYLPAYEWTLYAAQARQESAFDPRARSRVGAMGVMQLMPRTYQEQAKILRDRCSPWSPACSIKLGIHYDSRMYQIWDRRNRTDGEILPLMLASYNAGPGTVIKAQGLEDFRDYEAIKHQLPRETTSYVRRILEIWGQGI